jgi:hypothetical protein
MCPFAHTTLSFPYNFHRREKTRSDYSFPPHPPLMRENTAYVAEASSIPLPLTTFKILYPPTTHPEPKWAENLLLPLPMSTLLSLWSPPPPVSSLMTFKILFPQPNPSQNGPKYLRTCPTPYIHSPFSLVSPSSPYPHPVFNMASGSPHLSRPLVPLLHLQESPPISPPSPCFSCRPDPIPPWLNAKPTNFLVLHWGSSPPHRNTNSRTLRRTAPKNLKPETCLQMYKNACLVSTPFY